MKTPSEMIIFGRKLVFEVSGHNQTKFRYETFQQANNKGADQTLLFTNPKDRFSCIDAQIISLLLSWTILNKSISYITFHIWVKGHCLTLIGVNFSILLPRPLSNDPELPLQSRLKAFCGSILEDKSNKDIYLIVYVDTPCSSKP